jgi:hypothetical protein
MVNKFGNNLDDPAVVQAFELYLNDLPPLEQKRITKGLRNVNKRFHEISPVRINILDVLDLSDFSKIEMYINIVKTPRWNILVPHLKMFRNSILLQDYTRHWHKPQWLMYLSFVMYKYYVKKSDFEVIRKGLQFFDGTDIQRNKATLAYVKLSQSNKTLRVKDFYDYMNKYFTLETLELIGY